MSHSTISASLPHSLRPSLPPSSPTVSHPLSSAVHRSGAINNQLPSKQNHSPHCSVVICLNVEHRDGRKNIQVSIYVYHRLFGFYIQYIDTLYSVHKLIRDVAVTSNLTSIDFWQFVVFQPQTTEHTDLRHSSLQDGCLHN